MKIKGLILALLVAVLLAIMTACASAPAENESATEKATVEESVQKDAKASEPAAAAEDAPKEEKKEITLESIAALNSCSVDELNTVFDEDGHLTFIGNRISDTKITDEKGAEECINSMRKMLGLEGLAITYYKSDKSPKTGTVYYTFNQIATGNAGGAEGITVEFFNTTLKLAVGKDGYPNAVSAFLNYSNPIESEKNFITSDEAVKTVEEMIPGIHTYPEHTSLTYWEDTTSSAVNPGSRLSLVWLVYADDEMEREELADAISEQDADKGQQSDNNETAKKAESAEEELFNDEEACTEYYAFVISAVDNGEGRGSLLCILDAPSVDAYKGVVVNTTNAYFDEMEDAGEYTYTINFDWMSDEDREYSIKHVGSDTMQVTVPVMKSKKDGLYYLGEKEHHIFMSNFTDALVLSMGDIRQFNPYVTDDPSKLEAWHFKKDTYEATGQKYFDDPDYVIASFAEYVDTVMAFGNKFDLFNQYPTDSYLLTTYATDVPGVYPDSLRGFQYNAANGGQVVDWITFMTSPNLGLCLDSTVMSHEFTHGVNMHFANAKYMNEQGAMMESYADIIGYYMANLENEDDDWYIGGSFGPKLRSLKYPVKSEAMSRQPKYKLGVNYISPIDYELSYSRTASFDCGGVHINSGVPNYLGYLMTQGTLNGDDEERLTKEETLDLWYETLFLGNYDTDFIDQGSYFKYAAKTTGLSEKKINFMNRLLKRLGFCDGSVDGILLDGEESEDISITVEYDNTETADKYKMGTMLTYEDKDGPKDAIRLGGFADSLKQVSRIPLDVEMNTLRIHCNTAGGEDFVGKVAFDSDTLEYKVSVSHAEVDADEGYTIGKDKKLMNINLDENFKVNTDKESGETRITAKEDGSFLVITQKNGAPDGEYDACAVTFETAKEEEQTEKQAE